MTTGPVALIQVPATIPGTSTGPVALLTATYTYDTKQDVWVLPTARGFPSETRVNYYRIGGKADIDAAVEDTYPLYVVPPTKKATIRYVVVRCTAASGVTAVALVSVGVGANLGAIYADQQLLGLTTSGLRFVFPNGPGSQGILNAGESLNFTISQAAVGNSQLVDVDVFGDEYI